MPEATFSRALESSELPKRGAQAPSRRLCGRLCVCRPSRRCCVKWLYGLIMMLFFSVAIVLPVGLKVEANAVARANDTLSFYAGSTVCASNGSRREFYSEAAALLASFTPLHCGECGGCSSARDLQIYNETRLTLTKSATRCALRVFFGGSSAVTRCFDQAIGFSAACTPCWVDNVLCDQRKCLFTCLWGLLRGEENNRDDAPSELSACLKCDERLCGPAFIRCAGANRRRSGITSDIMRSTDQEMCRLSWS